MIKKYVTENNMSDKKIMILGAGELGKELVISLQRLGVYTIAVDKYPGAPAMQVAHEFEVLDMLNPDVLRQAVLKHKPDIIVPEIEAICTEELVHFEDEGIQVVPTARAAHLTMNRDAIRDLAAKKLKLKTPKYAYATDFEEFKKESLKIGFPSVVKPVMSSSGKGQSVMTSEKDIKKSWDYALEGMRGKVQKVIVEEFIKFESEITLLTVKQKKGPTLFVDPIGHRQERGDYQESWMPAKISGSHLKKAMKMARQITDELGGAGIFGVEFFLTKKDVYFSELSPRPHDTGLVTLISQNLSEFDLHARAILGLPIPEIQSYGPSASAVILSSIQSNSFLLTGLSKALVKKQTDIRVFGKPEARPYRRMGVCLARAKSIKAARARASESARQIMVKPLSES